MSLIQTIGSRANVMHGTAKKTSGGLTKSQLKYNKQGKIVSKKVSALAKKNNNLVKAGYKTKGGVGGIVKGQELFHFINVDLSTVISGMDDTLDTMAMVTINPNNRNLILSKIQTIIDTHRISRDTVDANGNTILFNIITLMTDAMYDLVFIIEYMIDWGVDPFHKNNESIHSIQYIRYIMNRINHKNDNVAQELKNNNTVDQKLYKNILMALTHKRK